jgi:hypothetical protein
MIRLLFGSVLTVKQANLFMQAALDAHPLSTSQRRGVTGSFSASAFPLILNYLTTDRNRAVSTRNGSLFNHAPGAAH